MFARNLDFGWYSIDPDTLDNLTLFVYNSQKINFVEGQFLRLTIGKEDNLYLELNQKTFEVIIKGLIDFQKDNNIET